MLDSVYFDHLASVLKSLRPYALRGMNQLADAEDALQQTFLELASSPVRPENIFNYTFGALRNQMSHCRTRYIRDRRRLPPLSYSPDSPECSSGEPSGETLRKLIDGESELLEAAALDRSINRLGTNMREMMTRAFRSETKAGIRGAMHLSDTQYRLLRCRAKKRLAGFIRQTGVVPWKNRQAS